MSNTTSLTIATSDAVAAIIPSTFDSVMEFAKLTHLSGIAPHSLDTKEKIAIAMFKGLEIGLPPMMALSSIAIINNRPCLFGDGAMALCVSKPICDGVEEFFEGEGDKMVAVCIAHRRNGKRPVERRFSVEDAKRAGLWQTEAVITRMGRNGEYTKDNDSPWWKYPKRMLQMRARSTALRDAFPDVLGGFGIVEEERDNMKDITPTDEMPPAPEGSAPPKPPKAVEGEILPPEKKGEPKGTGAKPEPEKKAEKAEEKQPVKQPEQQSENEQAEDEMIDGYRRKFIIYMNKLEMEMRAVIDDQAALLNVWKARNKDWTKDEIKMLNDLRDKLAAVHNQRAQERSKAESGKPQEQGQDEFPGDSPAGGNGGDLPSEEDFSEYDFRSVFAQELDACKSAKEVVALSKKVDALKERGLITQKRFSDHYEEPLMTAIERLEQA